MRSGPMEMRQGRGGPLVARSLRGLSGVVLGQYLCTLLGTVVHFAIIPHSLSRSETGALHLVASGHGSRAHEGEGRTHHHEAGRVAQQSHKTDGRTSRHAVVSGQAPGCGCTGHLHCRFAEHSLQRSLRSPSVDTGQPSCLLAGARVQATSPEVPFGTDLILLAPKHSPPA